MPTQDQQERIVEIVRQVAQQLVNEMGISLGDALEQIAKWNGLAGRMIGSENWSVSHYKNELTGLIGDDFLKFFYHVLLNQVTGVLRETWSGAMDREACREIWTALSRIKQPA